MGFKTSGKVVQYQKKEDDRFMGSFENIEVPDFLKRAVMVGLVAFVTYLAKELQKNLEDSQ